METNTALEKHFPCLGQPILHAGIERNLGRDNMNTLLGHYRVPSSFRARVFVYSNINHPFKRVFIVNWRNNDPTRNGMPDLRPQNRVRAREILQESGSFFSGMLRFVDDNLDTLNALYLDIEQVLENNIAIRRALMKINSINSSPFQKPTKKMIRGASLLDASMLHSVTSAAGDGADLWEQVFACIEGFRGVYRDRDTENSELYSELYKFHEIMNSFTLLHNYFTLVDDTHKAVALPAHLVGQLARHGTGIPPEISRMIWR